MTTWHICQAVKLEDGKIRARSFPMYCMDWPDTARTIKQMENNPFTHMLLLGEYIETPTRKSKIKKYAFIKEYAI